MSCTSCSVLLAVTWPSNISVPADMSPAWSETWPWPAS
jgi:hypothetical protein